MLFASFGMEIASNCIILNQNDSSDNKTRRFCTGEDQSLVLHVSGVQYYSDISQYVLADNYQISVFLGDAESASKHLTCLESLEIPYSPKKTP
jgi:hypothetical protein